MPYNLYEEAEANFGDRAAADRQFVHPTDFGRHAVIFQRQVDVQLMSNARSLRKGNLSSLSNQIRTLYQDIIWFNEEFSYVYGSLQYKLSKGGRKGL
jgi:hypothetical protein